MKLVARWDGYGHICDTLRTYVSRYLSNDIERRSLLATHLSVSEGYTIRVIVPWQMNRVFVRRGEYTNGRYVYIRHPSQNIMVVVACW